MYREGEKRVGETFVCYMARRAGQGRKMGLAVSRKVGRAVVRNRVKRRIREIYRTHRNDIVVNDVVGQLGEDVHVVIVARQASASLNYHQSEEALRQLFQRNIFRAKQHGGVTLPAQETPILDSRFHGGCTQEATRGNDVTGGEVHGG